MAYNDILFIPNIQESLAEIYNKGFPETLDKHLTKEDFIISVSQFTIHKMPHMTHRKHFFLMDQQ